MITKITSIRLQKRGEKNIDTHFPARVAAAGVTPASRDIFGMILCL